MRGVGWLSGLACWLVNLFRLVDWYAGRLINNLPANPLEEYIHIIKKHLYKSDDLLGCRVW